MAGSGTYYDLDFAASAVGFTRKTLVSSYAGSAKGGFALGLRADGRLDPSVHPVNGLGTSKMAPGVHLDGVPNGNFEDGLDGWTTAATGTGTVAVIDASSGNQVTGQNSAKLVLAASGDTSSVTSPMEPCGASDSFYLNVQAKSASGKASIAQTVQFYDRTKTAIAAGSGGSVTALAATVLTTAFARYAGSLVVPPAGACYRTTTTTASGAADTISVDEVGSGRAILAGNLAPNQRLGGTTTTGFAASPTFTEASGVLGRGVIFDSGTFANPGTVNVPAGKELDMLGWREANIVQAANSTVDMVSFQLTTNGADGTTNCYGVIGAVHNAGKGNAKALYGRTIADSGCTGVVVGAVIGAETRNGVSASIGVQVTCASADATPINYGVILDANATNANATLNYQYGFLGSSKCAFTSSFIQGFAVGTGNAFTWMNASGSAALAVIDSAGNGTFNSLSVGDQSAVNWANDKRNYQLQALDSTQAGNERLRVNVGGVGEGLNVDSGLNVGVGGMTVTASGAKGALGIVNGTAPANTPTGGGILFVVGGVLKYKGTSGTVTTLANA